MRASPMIGEGREVMFRPGDAGPIFPSIQADLTDFNGPL